MASISLQQEILYGPVLSRRFGRSFGINLLPVTQKVCSFDCRYCEYGKTISKTCQPSGRILPEKEDVLKAIEQALKKPRTIESLTFSGNGEPTLHPDFFEIVLGVKQLRDRYRPESKLAVLSNSSCLHRPDIVSAISLFDLPMMKLDAGDAKTFVEINQSVNDIGFEDILDGLASLPRLMIQTMLIDGEIANCRGRSYQAWVQTLVDLHPERVHIYSTERPTAYVGVIPVSPLKLQQIETELRDQSGLNVEAFWRNR